MAYIDAFPLSWSRTAMIPPQNGSNDLGVINETEPASPVPAIQQSSQVNDSQDLSQNLLQGFTIEESEDECTLPDHDVEAAKAAAALSKAGSAVRDFAYISNTPPVHESSQDSLTQRRSSRHNPNSSSHQRRDAPAKRPPQTASAVGDSQKTNAVQLPSNHHNPNVSSHEQRDLPAKRPPQTSSADRPRTPPPAAQPQQWTQQDDGRAVHYLPEFPSSWLLTNKLSNNVSIRRPLPPQTSAGDQAARKPPATSRPARLQRQDAGLPLASKTTTAPSSGTNRSAQQQHSAASVGRRNSAADVMPWHPAKRTKLFVVAHGRVDLNSTVTAAGGGGGVQGQHQPPPPYDDDDEEAKGDTAAAAGNQARALRKHSSSSSAMSTYDVRGARQSRGDTPARFRRMMSSEDWN